jgi:hypothetical protein
MTLEQMITLLAREVSGVRAKDDVCRIARHHRIQGSPGLLDAAQEVQGLLNLSGIDVVLHRFPADGDTSAFGWTSPPFWTVRSGQLELDDDEQELLACFDEIPQAIVAHSPGGTAAGELIHVGEGTRDEQYQGRDVAGRFVLAHGRARQVAQAAARHGAAAIVIYPQGARAAAGYDLVQYVSIFPSAGEMHDMPLAFSVSRRIADRVLEKLEKGPVRLRGTVDAELGVGQLPVVEATLPGARPDLREILLTAHICHPRQSANDNASGSGVLLEVARSLARLSNAGTLPLQRSVRLLWVPEFFGTLFWAKANREQIARVLYCLNLDMVGQSPERIGSPFCVSRIPGSVAGFVNAWFEPLLRRIGHDERTVSPHGTRRAMHWQLTSPSGGSDHLVFNDRPFQRPAVMFGHPDPFWHTDGDLTDLVDPTELKRVGILTAAMCALPGLAEKECDRLRAWLLRYSTGELARAAEIAHHSSARFPQMLQEVALTVERRRATDFAAFAVESTLDWDAGRHESVLSAAHRGLQVTAGADDRNVSGGGSPSAVAEGPLPRTFREALSREDRTFLDAQFAGNHGMMLEEIVNLSDGTRSTAEIAAHLALDFETWLDPDIMERALGLLADGGILER